MRTTRPLSNISAGAGLNRRRLMILTIGMSAGLAGCGGSGSTEASSTPTSEISAASSSFVVTKPLVAQTVLAGQTAMFTMGVSVSAAGASSLSYQWQKSGAGIPGSDSFHSPDAVRSRANRLAASRAA